MLISVFNSVFQLCIFPYFRIQLCPYFLKEMLLVVLVVVYLMSTLSPPTIRGDILRQLFHQCISHESSIVSVYVIPTHSNI